MACAICAGPHRDSECGYYSWPELESEISAKQAVAAALDEEARELGYA